jgi:nucleotide-binding universal stress UspA family protein
MALANALSARIALVRVLEVRPASEVLPDPIEWQLLRRQAQDDVKQLVRKHEGTSGVVAVHVIEGQAPEQICQWVDDHGIDITVIGTHGEGATTEWELGSTARKVIDRVSGSILVVPATAPEDATVHYRRIMVPLDGSSRAESAIAPAVRLATSEGGEVILIHVVPTPELTESGPLEAEDIELRDRLIQRNERVAAAYLDRTRSLLTDTGITVRTLILQDGDVRSGVTRAAIEEAVDLVVLSAHGRSGRSDVSFGSTAAHLIAHVPSPLLIVRRHPAVVARRDDAMSSDADIRLPDHAAP